MGRSAGRCSWWSTSKSSEITPDVMVTSLFRGLDLIMTLLLLIYHKCAGLCDFRTLVARRPPLLKPLLAVFARQQLRELNTVWFTSWWRVAWFTEKHIMESPEELGQYQCCWCPCSLRRHSINRHDIDYLGLWYWTRVFHEEELQLSAPLRYWDMIDNTHIFWCSPQNSMQRVESAAAFRCSSSLCLQHCKVENVFRATMILLPRVFHIHYNSFMMILSHESPFRVMIIELWTFLCCWSRPKYW